jgi:RNA polymerase sigma-70 factor (ECF subfamily)
MTRLEEQRLIAKAAAGCRSAAQSLVKAHQQSLYAYLVRLSGRPELAEDVIQEAFIRVLTNLDKFDPRYRFSTWLFTIARRVYLNIVARHSPVYVENPPEIHTTNSPEPREDDNGGLLRDALQKALMSLSFVQREIVVLFHQCDWPIWLIAEHLEIPEGTVKSHLHRARKQLKEVLEGNPQLARVVEEARS